MSQHKSLTASQKFTGRRGLAALACVGALTLVSACGAEAVSSLGSDDSVSATTTAANAAATTYSDIADTHADTNDAEYATDGATSIELADGGTQVSGDGASVDGDVVSISAAGTYLVSGTLSDGRIVVNSPGDGKVNLVLDNADITSSDNSPIAVEAADEAVVILAEGSTNVLSDGQGSAADDDVEDAPTATLYSMADLTIAGPGRLDVTSVTNDGIGSKDGLVVLSGVVNVEATDDGIRGKDYAVVNGGNLTIRAGGDGLKADNETAGERGVVQVLAGRASISAGDDGIDAIGTINLSGGRVDVTESLEGLEAAVVNLNGGTNTVRASDDAINATDSTGESGEGTQEGVTVNVTGGNTTVTADGGDALDSNGVGAMTGGTLVLQANNSGGGGTGAIDLNGDFDVDGGNLIAMGGFSAAPSGNSGQGFVAAALTTTVNAGQAIAVVDESGQVVARYVTPEDTSQVLFSAAGIENGQSYTFRVGDAGGAQGFSEGGNADALAEAGSATAGEFSGGFGGRR